MPNIDKGNISSVQEKDQSSTPTTPDSGFKRLFVKADGFYIVNDSGEVTKHVVNTPTTTAQNTIQPSAADIVGLTVESHATQSADISQLGDVDGGNYTAIEADGTLEFNGTAIVWDDLQISASNVRLPAASAPTWTAYKGGQVLAFSPTQDNLIYFTAQLTHSYAEGEDIEFHIHVVYPDGNAGNSIWNFTHSWANIGADFPAETTVAGVSVASPTTTDRHQLAEIADPIDGTGKTISSVLICSLEREGSIVGDTYASNVYLTSVDFHIPLNTVGSRQEGVK